MLETPENELLDIAKSAYIAIDVLIKDRPILAAKITGHTTLGNIRAELKAAVKKFDKKP